MADAPSFAKFVPGFDFLQGLVKNAGAALPSIGQWVAPTLESRGAREAHRRTAHRAVLARAEREMLAATIQALEVQRMTLSTLKTMNVQMEDLRDSLQIRMPGVVAGTGVEHRRRAPEADETDSAADWTTTTTSERSRPRPPRRRRSKPRAPAAKTAPAKPGGVGVVDPLQWWGALTKQFTELAANAMKETAADAAKSLAGNMMKQSFDAAADTLKGSLPGAKAAAAKKKPAARKRTAAKR